MYILDCRFEGELVSGEFKRLAQNGREVWMQATYNPITDVDGTVLKVMKFATDISAQVQERQRRAEAQRTISTDLDAIGTAVEAVTRQTAEAAGTVGQVSNDIQAVTSGRRSCRPRSARSVNRSATPRIWPVRRSSKPNAPAASWRA